MIQLRCVPLLTVAVLICSGACASEQRAQNSQPDLRSYAALVIDADSAAILYERNANTPRPIASITKLMTALVVLESALPLDEEIVIEREDKDSARGAASRLSVGGTLTRGDLLHLALMASDNRAACALGRSYPGGKPAFVQAMNAKALALGMTTAHFVDPSGLLSGNVASAADIAKLLLAAARHTTIREYSTDPHYTVMLAKREVRFRNTNYLVAKSDWDIEAQKTGYTSEAGECLAMKAMIQGRSLVIVLLDSFGKYTRTADARRIRKWLEARPVQQVAHAST